MPANSTVYSLRDSSLVDVVKAVTSVKQPPPPSWRADGLIRGATDAADLGDNVYNITGEDQTVQQTATSETAASFFITAQNDGSAPQKLAVTGATDMPWWDIRYVDSNNNDITGSIAAGGWLTPVLMPGESALSVWT